MSQRKKGSRLDGREIECQMCRKNAVTIEVHGFSGDILRVCNQCSKGFHKVVKR